MTALEARVDDVQLSHFQQALIHDEQKLQTQLQSLSTSSYGSQPTSALLGRQRKTKINKVKVSNANKQVIFAVTVQKGKVQMVEWKQCTKQTAAEDNSSDSDTNNIEVFIASVRSVDTQQMGKWLVDSGASSHTTREKALLFEYQEFKTPEKVSLGDGRTIDAIGVGNVHVK